VLRSLDAILLSAGLAATLSLTSGHAEVLTFDSAFAIDGVAVASEHPPVEADVVIEAASEDFADQSDLNRGTLAVTVPSNSSSWVTALFNLFGFGR
jgi:hypothetical protein